MQVLPVRPDTARSPGPPSDPTPARRGALRRRVGDWAHSTPGRLTGLMILIICAALLVGVASVLGTVRRADSINSVRTSSGPLTVSAQRLYRSLSDADATAASAFLSNGVEPAALRDRYSADIAAASLALTEAAAASDSDQGAVREISSALPVYTGLVDTARTYNRMNLPLGAAYLREASWLMRDGLLPAAERLYQSRTQRLAADRGAAAGLPWVTLLLILLTLGGLVVSQVYLMRHTHRVFNVGLGVATLATLALLVWLSVSWVGDASAMHAAQRDGSAQVETLSRARLHALQARADEALTLVTHGNGAAFEADFNASFGQFKQELEAARRQAGDAAVSAALADAAARSQSWTSSHAKVRDADNNGQYADAVKLLIGTGDAKGATAAFNALDADLATAIADTNATFDKDAARAGGWMAGTGVGFGLLTLVLLVGSIAGFQQRIAEYR